MADPRIDYCCKGDAALKQHFQMTKWRDWMELVGQPGMHHLDLSRYIRQNIPDCAVPEQAAKQLLKHMIRLTGVSSRQPSCIMLPLLIMLMLMLSSGTCRAQPYV